MIDIEDQEAIPSGRSCIHTGKENTQSAYPQQHSIKGMYATHKWRLPMGVQHLQGHDASAEDLPTVAMESIAVYNENETTSNSNAAPEAIMGETRGRKRKVQPEKWKRHMRQMACNSGLPYVTRRGKLVSMKYSNPTDCTNCRFKCGSTISEAQRELICREYYSLPSFDMKKQFICTLVQEMPVKRSRSRSENRKMHKKVSRAYSFLVNGSGIRVCRNFFCKTLSVSFKVINTALAGKGESGAFVGSDKRIHRTPPNRIPDECIAHVKSHINQFPRVLPHYCRQNTRKEYLSPDLNIKQMYRLYRDDYCTRLGIPPVKEHKYRHIFTHDFNLKCFTPKKDQCSLCNSYYRANEEEKLLKKIEFDQHKQREKESMEEKASDKKRAVSDSSFIAATFDLQAVLGTPHGGDCQIYYKRKLAVYNFTIFETASHQGYCYLWDETQGGRGSNEIGSSLMHYMKSLPQTVSYVSKFSDTCGGQNRNVYVASVMLLAVQNISNLQIIDMKFMESGHSYLEADSMHSTIEKAYRHKSVYTTREWEMLIGCARKQKPHFVVHRRFHTDVHNLKTLAGFVKNRSRNRAGELVQWLKIKWMRFEKSRPYIIQYKYSITSEVFMELDTSMRRGRPTEISGLSLVPAYNVRRPISTDKKKDLLSLLGSGIIPQEHASFYQDLPCCGDIQDRLPEPDASEITDEE